MDISAFFNRCRDTDCERSIMVKLDLLLPQNRYIIHKCVCVYVNIFRKTQWGVREKFERPENVFGRK